MAQVDWRLKGEWMKNCNCAYGCPCDFNARPTHEVCHGLLMMNVQKGYFGTVKLDGVKFLVNVDFPGPLHEGHGTAQAVIDERATAEQRSAILEILSGKHSDAGTIFNIFALITEKVLDPIFAPIEFSFDLAKRRARVDIPGVMLTETQPIRNPVTGAEHRIQVVMPDGFEHRGAEVAAASIESTGGIKYKVPSGHSSLTIVEHAPQGVIA